MITRFYVDNYKCLQNFEYKPGQLELIVGANGTGKTTVFEALDKVRRFVTGQADAKELFLSENATRWGNRSVQIFELDYTVEDIEFQYRLEINLLSSRCRVEKESLKRAGALFFETTWEKPEDDISGYVSLSADETDEFHNDFHEGEFRFGNLFSVRIRKFPVFSQNKSAFSQIMGSFKERVSQIHFFKINPAVMTSQVGKVEPRPANDLSNFASYYLYLLQQKQGRMFEMIPHLREAIPDFDSFAIEEDFEAARRNLRIVCKPPSGKNGASGALKYGFEEMSDGQRALIVLYTLLFCTLDSNATLIIDEPENYVALRELQPWLMLLQERLEEYGGQVILISHHPEFINALAPSHTTIFERENAGPVRVKAFDSSASESLSPAEIMARGWENE